MNSEFQQLLERAGAGNMEDLNLLRNYYFYGQPSDNDVYLAHKERSKENLAAEAFYYLYVFEKPSNYSNYNRDYLKMMIKNVADRGNAWAQHELGTYYYTGISDLIKRDLIEAVKYYKKSANQGFDPAKKMLIHIKNELQQEFARDEKELLPFQKEGYINRTARIKEALKIINSKGGIGSPVEPVSEQANYRSASYARGTNEVIAELGIHSRSAVSGSHNRFSQPQLFEH